MGRIAENKTKTTIVIEKDLREKLKEQAVKEHRSFNNLIVSILKDYFEE